MSRYSADKLLGMHHFIADSINPGLAADAKNLVVISVEVHDDYHAWACEQSLKINRTSLKKYVRKNGYDVSWATNSEGAKLNDYSNCFISQAAFYCHTIAEKTSRHPV